MPESMYGGFVAREVIGMAMLELVEDLFESEIQGEILAFSCTKALSFEDE